MHKYFKYIMLQHTLNFVWDRRTCSDIKIHKKTHSMNLDDTFFSHSPFRSAFGCFVLVFWYTKDDGYTSKKTSHSLNLYFIFILMREERDRKSARGSYVLKNFNYSIISALTIMRHTDIIRERKTKSRCGERCVSKWRSEGWGGTASDSQKKRKQ